MHRVLVLLAVVAVTGTALGSFWLLPSRSVDASEHSAERSFSATTVDPGDSVTVTIVANDYGGLGRIVETLPAGFTSPEADANGETVTLRLLAAGPQTVTYTVTAPDSPGDHIFEGYLQDQDRDQRDVGGEDTITITGTATTPDPTPAPGEPIATRSFSADTVAAGEDVVVSITADNYGGLGRIVEALPAGFTSSDAVSGVVTFRLLSAGPQTSVYTVTAPDTAGSYDFAGTLQDEDRTETAIGGDTTLTVTAPDGPAVSRSLSATSVGTGESFTVTVTADNYGGLARIIETLPDGFTSPDAAGQTVTIRLLTAGPQTRTYTVTASEDVGDYTITGVLEDENRVEHPVGGDASVTVVTVDPSATRSFSSGTVRPGGSLTVTIVANNYGGVGRIIETLPDGFTSPDAVGQTVTIRLLSAGPQTSTYTVTAATSTGTYRFSGMLQDEDRASHAVGGDSSVTVRVPPPPTPEPTPTTTPDTTAPTVSWNAPSSLMVNEKISPMRPITSDRDIDSYTVLNGTLPRGLRLDSETGAITGRPVRESSAPTTVTIQACDTSGNCASVEVKFPAVRFTGDYEPAPTPVLPEVPEPDITRISVGDAAPSKWLQLALAAAGSVLLLGGLGAVAVRRRARR